MFPILKLNHWDWVTAEIGTGTMARFQNCGGRHWQRLYAPLFISCQLRPHLISQCRCRWHHRQSPLVSVEAAEVSFCSEVERQEPPEYKVFRFVRYWARLKIINFANLRLHCWLSCWSYASPLKLSCSRSSYRRLPWFGNGCLRSRRFWGWFPLSSWVSCWVQPFLLILHSTWHIECSLHLLFELC